MRLIKGNEAVVYGAILGGATHFFGYPITPASEIAHAAAILFGRTGRHFLQAESEVNVINMLFGASAAGARVMTASSGPGISLMQEGLSYIAGAELPCVVINVQRAGPGLGNIWPEQSDYNATVKGGGHGNYKNFVFAPNSAQEMCDFSYRAFEIADKYRITVFILADAYIGQIMEPVRFPEKVKHSKRKDWALYADKMSRKNLITSIYMNTKLQSDHNKKLQAKYKKIEEAAVELEEIETNAIYGMTGGQMAPTTLIGQKTKTTPEGRSEKKGRLSDWHGGNNGHFKSTCIHRTCVVGRYFEGNESKKGHT